MTTKKKQTDFFTIRLPSPLRRQIKTMARREGRSESAQARRLIETALAICDRKNYEAAILAESKFQQEAQNG